MATLDNLFASLRSLTSVHSRKTRHKIKSASIRELIQRNSGLLVSDQTHTNIPVDKTDAVFNILPLPLELIELILQYCTTSSIQALMRTNRAIYSAAVRELYASVRINVHWHSFPSKLSYIEITKVAQFLVKEKIGALGCLLRRPENMASLRHLHIIEVSWGEHFIHRIIRYILHYAVSIQSLTIFDERPIPYSEYSDLHVPSSLKHISIPNFQPNLMTALSRTAHLHSIRITSKCTSLSALQALGEEWGSTLRHFQCIVHVPKREPDPSLERIDEFAANFPRLNSLRYGYCTCASSSNVPIKCYARMISRLPELTSITIDDHRGTMGYHQNEENCIISAFSQESSLLNLVGIRYVRSAGYWEIVWKAAHLSIIERSRDVEGEVCIWTPDPCQRERWIFWLNTFGPPIMARQAMLDRWPGSSIPTLLDLEKFALSRLSMLNRNVLRAIVDSVPQRW